MASVQRYLFDRSFGQAAAGMPDPESPPPPLFTAADIEAAHAQGYAAGRAESQEEASVREAAEQRLAATLEAITAALAQRAEAAAAAHAQAQRNALLVAAAICRKLLPHSYRTHACGEVEATVAAVLRSLPSQIDVRVRIAPELLGAVAPRLQDAASVLARAGTLAVIGEPGLAAGDCRIEWARGGVLREQSLLWQEIDAVLDEMVPADPRSPARLASPADASGGTDA